MKQDQEPKCYLCKFCNRSFSNGKKLGGHMRCHLALISAITKQGTQEFINGEKGIDFDQEIVNKSQRDINGGKQRIEENDQESINSEKGFNFREKGIQEFFNGEKGIDFDDEIVKKSQNGRKQRIQENTQESINGVGFNRKQGNRENDEDFINGEKGIDFDDENDEEMIKKSQRDFDGRKQGIQESDEEVDSDQDYGSNVYVLRENPKRSWRVSNSSNDFGKFCIQCGKGFDSSKALATHKRCHSTKLLNKNTVCEKCGKGFDSVKALYGHMRCHSIKRSRSFDESTAFSSSNEHDGVVNPVRKKRSCTRYKSFNPFDDGEVEEGAICLMMLSRGVRDSDEGSLVISHQTEFSFSDFGYSRNTEKNVEFEVSDGSMDFCEFKNKNDLGLKKDLIFGSGSGQEIPGKARSTFVKYKSTKKPMSYDQDLSDKAVTDAKITVELKRKSKEYKCLVCFKEFASGQALGSHKRIHNKPESKGVVNNDIRDMRRLVDFNLDEGGLNNGDVEFKLTWIHSGIEWDPLTMVN